MEIKRRNYFIDRDFQAKFIIKFCAIVLASSLVITLIVISLSQNFTTVAVRNARVVVDRAPDFLFPIFATTVATVFVFTAIAVIILTLLTSHKIAGPLYRLKREIVAFSGGDLAANFRTRHNDQLQDLAKTLADMGDTMKQRHKNIKNRVSELLDLVQKDDKEGMRQKLLELEEELNYFKV